MIAEPGTAVWLAPTITLIASATANSSFAITAGRQLVCQHVLESTEQVRAITESWLREYNRERPHNTRGRVPPPSASCRGATLRESTSESYP